MKKGRAAAIWFAALLLTAAAGLFFSRVMPKLLEPPEEDDKTFYVDTYNYFYEPEWVESVAEREGYEEYEGLDRFIYVKSGGLVMAMTDENERTLGEESVFLKRYFEAAIAGDADAYNALFSRSYLKTHGEKPPFTPQMIYDVVIERIGRTFVGNATSYTVDLNYKIFRNDGTFRDDVYSDATRTLRLTIDDADGEMKITSVLFYT